ICSESTGVLIARGAIIALQRSLVGSHSSAVPRTPRITLVTWTIAVFALSFAIERRKRGRWGAVAIIWLSLVWAAASGARSPARINATACTQAAARPVATIELPGNPFQAIPTSDGCYVFVSLVGPVEPSDPRRPPRPGASMGGVAVISRVGGEPS